ncbi:MAG: hypothetical protein O3C28_19475 [Proteobacteria bacterium]|nr:hypothetical protein [Pseudomonadota bacterium]
MVINNDEQASLALAHLYHSWITGLVLSLVAHKGADLATQFLFRLFRQQHLERFLPGLVKLGLDKLPHAVAAAQYHYFSNQLGGVKVEYLEVSDRKAWVRYPPPRWIWSGTAICAIPAQVNHAMLHGWHAHNGVSLNNPRLGFVCTKSTVEGQPGLEGYYFEYDRDLKPEERLRFAPDESCPAIDRSTLPRLDVESWPSIRQAKAYRNYSMEYIRNSLPILIELLGDDEALRIGRLCGRQIGMQHYDEISARLGIAGDDRTSFLDLLKILLVASGDDIESCGDEIHRTSWRLFGDIPTSDLLFAVWRAPFEGLLAVHNRFLQFEPGLVEQFKLTDC